MKIVPFPTKTETCRQCGGVREWDPCFYCIRKCRRKQTYWTHDFAEIVRKRLSPRPWDDPTLEVFRCVVEKRAHFHLGHASGSRARVLAKRAERMRRKALMRERGIA